MPGVGWIIFSGGGTNGGRVRGRVAFFVVSPVPAWQYDIGLRFGARSGPYLHCDGYSL